MGYSRAKIVDADQPDRVLALIEGQGVTIGTPPDGLAADGRPTRSTSSTPPISPRCGRCSGLPAATDGHWALPELVRRCRLTGCGAAHRPAVRRPGNRRDCAAAPSSPAPTACRASPRTSCSSRGAKVGPFRVDDRADDRGGGTVAVRVLMHDEGDDDRLTTSAPIISAS